MEKQPRTREKMQRCLALIEMTRDGREYQVVHLAHVFGVHPCTISNDLKLIKSALDRVPEYVEKLKIARNLFVRPAAKVRKAKKRKKSKPRKKRPYKKCRPPSIQWVNTVKLVKPAPRKP